MCYMLMIASYPVFSALCYMFKKHNIIFILCTELTLLFVSTKPSTSTPAYSYQYISKAPIRMRLGSSNHSVALRYTRAVSSRPLSSSRMPLPERQFSSTNCLKASLNTR